jgi:hypothetical protein
VGVLLDWSVHATKAARVEARIRLGCVPPHLGRRIVTTGRRLACADPAADHAYVRDMQLRAADVEPFLRRTRRIKLEALRR